jgi:hypothetical protein
MLASMGLSSSCFHSSGVKLALFAIVAPSHDDRHERFEAPDHEITS